MVHIPLNHTVGFEPTINRGLLDFYFKYILCMYMYYIDDFLSISVSMFVIVLFPFFKDVVLVYLYYMYFMHKVYYLNIYRFLFLFKKYYKISKDKKNYPNSVKSCTGVLTTTSISSDRARILYNFTAVSGQFSSTSCEMMSPMRSVRLHFSILLMQSARCTDFMSMGR